jgi:GMP synthase (glutamine-hydrolysing)
MARKLLRRFVHHARGLQTVAGHPAAHTQKQR